jgi:hypothetical protein
MKLQTEVTTGTSTEKSERIFFICPHIAAGDGKVAEGYHLNPEPGERAEVLCHRCFWGVRVGDPPYDENTPIAYPEERKVFTEQEAVAHRWIPKTRAMQYLLSITNDVTGGQAVESRSKRLAFRLHWSGLNDAETDFLWEVFRRGTWKGETNERGLPVFANHYAMAELSEEDELIADMVVRKMWSEKP